MTFDEANKIVEAFDEDPELEDWMPDSKVYEIIECLRKEYAPTVEMTSSQKETLLTMKENKKSLVVIVAEFYHDNLINDFDNVYWFPLTETMLVQAWLHPETIKIDDE